MSDAVERALSENHALIAAILEHHCNNRPLPAVALLERVQINLEFVAAVAEHGVPLAPPAPAPAPAHTHAPPLTAGLPPQSRIAPAPVSLAPAPLPNVTLAPAPQQQQQQQQQSMYWSNEEHARFEQGMRIHGDKGKDGKPDFKAIATMVGTRTPVQVRTHLQKIQKRPKAGEGSADPVAVSNAAATTIIPQVLSSPMPIASTTLQLQPQQRR